MRRGVREADKQRKSRTLIVGFHSVHRARSEANNKKQKIFKDFLDVLCSGLGCTPRLSIVAIKSVATATRKNPWSQHAFQISVDEETRGCRLFCPHIMKVLWHLQVERIPSRCKKMKTMILKKYQLKIAIFLMQI
ncbi:hypothetical protein E2562_030505 [Oryza meyeriana var. granulata]|uniref:Uncharacterized protein n=1 Tax=Oryza meyeriana var. granulata TaxID=110450 RepID=A0A6G1BQN0_9ORYZ|nr:hypothetical protein E2562_030505 [Oryza meyeriana var. granulata]